MRLIIIITVLGLAFSSCQQAPSAPKSAETEPKAVLASYESNQFNAYWYAGKAEISSYDYTINRYDQDRNGYAIMVFVTEDLSKEKQVKLDDPAKAGNDRVPVLKLNALQRFQTGIYDYSMMSSLFTPVDIQKNPHSLKLTTTVQDWCGHVFTQLNLKGDKYQTHQYSYFEMEGDKSFSTEGVLLEDDIFTRLRINPESLPKGEVKMIPNLTYTRLRHKDITPLKANISIKNASNGMSICEVQYPEVKRRVTFDFETAFPYKITGWTEYQGEKVMSHAKIKKTVISAYWMEHGLEHDNLRKDLGL
jgi:hypothetical protein